MRIESLVVYPVKGARAVPVAEASVGARGLAGDRRWMVVDEGGRAVTQRELPALARLEARPAPGGLALGLDGERAEAAEPGAAAPRRAVSLWRDAMDLPEAPEGSAALARWFGRPLRLVHQPDDAVRPTDPDWAPGDETSLADGFPLLVVTRASQEALARAAGAAPGELLDGGPFGMDRYRPNLVLAAGPEDGPDAEPWAEDGWAGLLVGGLALDLVKPCARCKVTTVDQARGLAPPGMAANAQPLLALRERRASADRRNPGPLFGWNAVARGEGTLRVGDAVGVTGRRAPWPVRAAGGAGGLPF